MENCAMFGFSTIPFIKIFGTWHFATRHFSKDISSTGHFGTWKVGPCGYTGTCTFHLNGCFDTRTFWHRDILAQVIFGTMDVSARDISAPEDFRTWMFCRLWNQYGHFGTLCQRVHGVKTYLCWKISVAKCPYTKMFMCWYIRRAEPCTCRNVSCRNGGMPASKGGRQNELLFGKLI